MIKIEKQKHKIPEPCHFGERKYPFPDMRIGDSFVADVRKRSVIMMCARGFKLRNKSTFKIMIRKISDTEIRIWRVK